MPESGKMKHTHSHVCNVIVHSQLLFMYVHAYCNIGHIATCNTMYSLLYCIYPNKSRAHINTRMSINTGVYSSKLKNANVKCRKG